MKFPARELHHLADAQLNFEYLEKQYNTASTEDIQLAAPSGDTSGSTDANTLAAAINALPTSGGSIRAQGGIYNLNALTALNDRRSIVIRGSGGLSAAATTATMLRFVGSTTSLQMLSTYGIVFEDLAIQQSNVAFTGPLVDMRHSGAGGDGSYNEFHRCILLGTSATGALVNLDKSNKNTFANCYFYNGFYGVAGQASGGASYSNGNTFVGCNWGQQGGRCVSNPGNGWVFSGGTFENLSGGGGNALSCDPGTASRGVKVSGMWFGDAGSSGTWINYLGVGLSLTGNYIGGGNVGVALGAGATGIVIAGNKFDATNSNAVVLAGGGSDVFVVGNDLSSVVGSPSVTFTGAIPANSLIQYPTAGGYINTIGMFPHAGAVTDASFPATPPDMTQAYDTTNNRIYIRNGGTWRSVAVT